MDREEYAKITILPEEVEKIKEQYASDCYSCKYATTMSRPWLEAGYVGCRAKWVVTDFDEREIVCSDSVTNFANTISRPFNWASNSWHQCLVIQGCVHCPFFKQF